jgi:CheY-like chemotaxis protein
VSTRKPDLQDNPQLQVDVDLLANISHQVLTPLNSINGVVELLTNNRLSAGQSRLVSILQTNTDLLSNSLNSILQYAKIHTASFRANLSDFCLLECIENVLDDLQSAANQKSIKLTYQVDPQVPARIVSDYYQFHQILYQLVSNAIKFSQQGRVSLALNCLSTTDPQQVVLDCQVTDQGMGISPQLLDQLLKSGNRPGDNPKQQGMGLGLAICRKLVQLNQGQLWAQSQLGEGSCFGFTYRAGTSELKSRSPAHQLGVLVDNGRSAKPQQQSTVPCQQANLRILLAEDNYFSQQVALAIFGKLGYQVDLASNGLEVMAMLANQSYHIIFMDIQMPQMDGLDTTQQILTQFPPQQRPIVIAMTANITQVSKEQCLALGMNDFLAKPVKMAKIAAIITKWQAIAKQKGSRSQLANRTALAMAE